MTSIYKLGNASLYEAYEWVISLFLGDWQGQRPNQINHYDAATRVSKEFKQLLATFPSYASELSDAFALEIRQELNRMEDKAIELQPYVHVRENGELKEPFSPTELAAWMAERQRSRESAIVELLHGPLPPSPTEARGVFELGRYKALGHRHKFDATIRLYQFVRECYEQHTPKQFALRPNLPNYYFKAPAKQLNEKEPIITQSISKLNLEDYLIDKCPISVCDKAAVQAGLHTGQSPRDYRDLRIHAFTDALKSSGSLQSAMVAIATVRQAVALRYGVVDYNPKYSPQHSKSQQGRNAAWDDCQTKPYKFLTKYYSRLPR